MLETGEKTATLTIVEGLVRAELYYLKGGLVAEKLNALGLTQS